MSWDLMLMKVPDTVRSANDLPNGFSPPVIGERADMVQRLERLLPELDFSRGWGTYATENTALTLDLISLDDEKVTIHEIGAQIHGGESGLKALLKVGQEFECAVFDFGTSMRIDSLEEAKRIFSDWKAYRDQVIGK